MTENQVSSLERTVVLLFAITMAIVAGIFITVIQFASAASVERIELRQSINSLTEAQRLHNDAVNILKDATIKLERAAALHRATSKAFKKGRE